MVNWLTNTPVNKTVIRMLQSPQSPLKSYLFFFFPLSAMLHSRKHMKFSFAFLPSLVKFLRSHLFEKGVHFCCVNQQYLINILLILPSHFSVTALHIYAGSSALRNHPLFSKSHQVYVIKFYLDYKYTHFLCC